MTTIATLVKRFALWKAQNGAKVADLEQCNASTSLPSTIKMIFYLRAFNWISLVLVFTWSWYYLGSQAVSREYTFRVSSSYKNTRIFIENTQAPSAFQNMTSLTDEHACNINSVYSINFGGSGQYFGFDLYGAAVIPMMNQTAASGLGKPEKNGGWQEFQFRIRARRNHWLVRFSPPLQAYPSTRQAKNHLLEHILSASPTFMRTVQILWSILFRIFLLECYEPCQSPLT